MLDFKELSKSGEELELLVRDLLFSMGHRVYWSGRGADRGRDLLVYEDIKSDFANNERLWLVQCKHHAIGGGSVGISELDNVVDSCAHHRATGYLLVTTTVPSSAVVKRLASISNNSSNPVLATYWDHVKLEQLLSTPTAWKIAQRFLPTSAQQKGWQVYATEEPNHWITVYRGYYLHVANRIGSKPHSFGSIDDRLNEIEAIQLPPNHQIRPRGVYYDDKNGNYVWYLDYLHPHNEEPVYSASKIKQRLGDGSVLGDGQGYTFDVQVRGFFPFSDHYDPDHYEYYTPFVDQYTRGSLRNGYRRAEIDAEYRERKALEHENRQVQNEAFSKLLEAFKRTPGLRVIRSENARIEDLSRFSRLQDWSAVIEDMDFETDRFFSAWFCINADSEDRLLEVAKQLPQSVLRHFRLSRVYVITPDGNYDPDDIVYDLAVTVHPAQLLNRFVGRKLLNDYFLELAEALNRINAADKLA